MAYKEASYSYLAYFDSNQKELEQAIVEVLNSLLEKPNLSFTFHQFGVMNDKKESYGYQIIIGPKRLELLKSQLEAKGIIFEEIFKRDWGHHHPYCVINKQYYECYAEEDESGWDMYYEDDDKGLVYPDWIPICRVEKTEINKLKDINRIFENWLKNYLGLQ